MANWNKLFVKGNELNLFKGKPWFKRKKYNRTSYLLKKFFFSFCDCAMACRILVPLPGIKPVPPGMWELDHKESWILKNRCFQIVVLEKTLESLLDCKEIKSVSPKGKRFWIFIGKDCCWSWAPILWPPDAKNRLIREDPDAGKDWREKEKGVTEDEMVR